MGETLQAIAQFLKLNPRTVFALFAAGIGLWILLDRHVVEHQPLDLAVAYITCFGLFVLLGFIAEKAITAAAALWKRHTANAAVRRTAVSNIGLLDPEEIEALLCIYNSGLTRVRASHNFPAIEGLSRLNILQCESYSAPRDPSKGEGQPPWLRQNRRRF